MEPAAAASFDLATVLRAVRRAVDDESAVIDEWSAEPIDYPAINPFSGGLFRVCGSARAAADAVTWSLVLKVVRCPDGVLPPDGRDPGPWREVLAYRSGILSDLAGVRAPRCFGVDERPAAMALLWLEDVPNRFGDNWPAEQYGRAVFFAYLAACALRTFLTASDLLLRPDPARFALEERRWGKPIAQILEQRAALTRIVLDRGEEALALLAER